jgi:hypothetical protein
VLFAYAIVTSKDPSFPRSQEMLVLLAHIFAMVSVGTILASKHCSHLGFTLADGSGTKVMDITHSGKGGPYLLAHNITLRTISNSDVVITHVGVIIDICVVMVVVLVRPIGGYPYDGGFSQTDGQVMLIQKIPLAFDQLNQPPISQSYHDLVLIVLPTSSLAALATVATRIGHDFGAKIGLRAE